MLTLDDIKKMIENTGVVDDPEKVKLYFTANDLLDIYNMAKDNNIKTLEGLVQYLNGKFKCNDVITFFKVLIDKGIEIKNELNIKAITEKREVKNGKFTLTNVPIDCGGYYFFMDMVRVKYKKDPNSETDIDTQGFYEDVEVNLDTLECYLGEDVDGVAIVTYFVNIENN